MLVPISAGVLRIGGAPESEGTSAIAGVLDSPGRAYLSHGSAAKWWGLPGFRLAAPVDTLIPWQGVTRRNRLAVVHYHRDLPAEHLTTLRGIPITSPALTIFLLAGSLARGRVERALDTAWSMRLVSHVELKELLSRLAVQGRNGIRMMRTLLDARGEAFVPTESGLESRVASLAHDVGVVVRPQRNVGGHKWIGRVDFQVESSNRVIEVLSERYHGSPSDRQRDQLRLEELASEGFKTLIIWDHEVWLDPESVRERILAFSRGINHPGLYYSAPKH